MRYVFAVTSCNSLSSPAEIGGGRLVAREVAGTLIGCADDQMDQEDTIRSLLRAGSTISILDARGGQPPELVLAGGGIELRAREAADGRSPAAVPPTGSTVTSPPSTAASRART